MMKNLILSSLMLASYTVAADKSSAAGKSRERITGEARTFKQYPDWRFDQLQEALNHPNATVEDPDFLKCDCRNFKSPAGSFTINRIENPAIKWEAPVAYFRIQAYRNGPFRTFQVKIDHAHEYVPEEQALQDSGEKLAVIKMTPTFEIRKARTTLVPLSKGLIFIAVTAGIGAITHYANQHYRLTTNVSADAILQEQKDCAQLPENQCSEIGV